jgi:peptide/nickel transport system permease protein
LLRTIGIKILLLIPVLLIVSFGTFMLVDLVPGDPAQQVLGPNSTAEDYERIREELGLNTPIFQRYGDWLVDVVVHQDLGKNLINPRVDVADTLKRAFPVNLQLALMAVGLALVLSIPAAMASAYLAGRRLDRGLSITTFGLISVPPYLSGLILVLLFALSLGWLPDSQWTRLTNNGSWTDLNLVDNLRSAALPVITIALNETAVFLRLLRGDLIGTLQEDFVLAAKAKGMPTWHVMVREALRPSSFSLITLAGVSLGRVIGGTVIVEGIFAIPGVGKQVVEAASKSDYPIVQGGVLVLAIFYVAVNMAVDILYGFLDPRIRRGR